jgi:hypothetical protein
MIGDIGRTADPLELLYDTADTFLYLLKVEYRRHCMFQDEFMGLS